MGIMIGYMRVSKTDGSQVLDLQKDALLEASVEERFRHPARVMTDQDWRIASKRSGRAIR